MDEQTEDICVSIGWKRINPSIRVNPVEGFVMYVV